MPRNPDRRPAHPCALLREDVVPATGVAKAEITRLHDILAERAPARCATSCAPAMQTSDRTTSTRTSP